MTTTLNTRPLIGLDYEVCGRGPKKFDCWGFVMHANRLLFGRELPDYTDYGNSDDSVAVATSMWQHGRDTGRWERIENALPGDLFQFRIGRFACHCGIHIGDGDFLHCLRGRGSTIENVRSILWNQRHVGTWRYIGNG